jgi:16S rRNA (adenine1518-N6/adenine1519-N6)-dimethyltransferase
MSTTIKLLKAHHIRPLKKYGQSFLTDDQIFRKIVDAGHLQPEDTVVEIGAGLGVMTDLLVERAAKVIAVEVDPHLIDILREKLSVKENVEVVHQDILTLDLSTIAPSRQEKKIKVMGNIPYNITSEILFHLLKFRKHIHSAVLLMQKEVAERLTAEPSTKAYGIPSVILSMYADLEILFHVSNQCFYPVPAVQSSLLQLVFGDEPRYPLQDEELFRHLVRASFAQRRKTLLNNLKSFRKIDNTPDEIQEILTHLTIDGSRRAESMTLAEFAALSNALMPI